MSKNTSCDIRKYLSENKPNEKLKDHLYDLALMGYTVSFSYLKPCDSLCVTVAENRYDFQQRRTIPIDVYKGLSTNDDSLLITTIDFCILMLEEKIDKLEEKNETLKKENEK